MDTFSGPHPNSCRITWPQSSMRYNYWFLVSRYLRVKRRKHERRDPTWRRRSKTTIGLPVHSAGSCRETNYSTLCLHRWKNTLYSLGSRCTAAPTRKPFASVSTNLNWNLPCVSSFESSLRNFGLPSTVFALFSHARIILKLFQEGTQLYADAFLRVCRMNFDWLS